MKRVILVGNVTAVNTLRELEPEADIWGCFEDFTVGPLPPLDDMAAFRRARGTYYADMPGMYGTVFAELVLDPFSNLSTPSLQEMMHDPSLAEVEPPDFSQVLRSAERIEIWGDRSASDQAMLLFLVTFLEILGVPADRIFTLMIETAKFVPLGCLKKEDFPPIREASPLGSERAAALRVLWHAYSGNAILPKNSAVSAEMEHAFAIRAGRQADPKTGLNNLQRRMLQFVPDDWTKMARVIAETMAAGWDETDTVGDAVLHLELERMGKNASAPVEIRGAGPEMRHREVRLATQGRAL
ncbi:hypothetical protein [Aliiruegeria sabulilitoris]|uniref:hypothetical protein n=1 Tax=Aliiruegeria sabulilitoris TaxID=1510458 RepID=UPI0012E3E65B|nr:hypothetical protein [Aliiruegeria sabulilitoris]NDR56082.1 hypothetical protein [Pseudoruegeria sp. M32A2M]